MVSHTASCLRPYRPWGSFHDTFCIVIDAAIFLTLRDTQWLHVVGVLIRSGYMLCILHFPRSALIRRDIGTWEDGFFKQGNVG